MLIKKPNVDMFCSHTGNNVKTLGFRNCVYEVITCLFWIPLFPSHLYNFHHEPNFGICQLLPNKLFCIILACLFFFLTFTCLFINFEETRVSRPDGSPSCINRCTFFLFMPERFSAFDINTQARETCLFTYDPFTCDHIVESKATAVAWAVCKSKNAPYITCW